MAKRSTIRFQARRFESIRSVFDFAMLMVRQVHVMQLAALHPRYKEYWIPKSHGGKRLIEDPYPGLKSVLKKLNHYLQSVYYTIRTEAAFGFVLSADEDDERNIVSNAKCHLGCKYLLNIDLQDFFHQISQERILQIFELHFESFQPDLTELLAKLVCYKSRLPMGSPCSPVLSNFATYELDQMLEAYCRLAEIRYTRYADDLSFSSKTAIKSVDFEHFMSCIHQCGFRVNSSKVRWAGPHQPKEITGLFLKPDGVHLAEDYLPRLEDEVSRYRSYWEVEARYRTGASHKRLRLLEQELRGKINFAGMVYPDSERVMQLRLRYDTAKEVLEDFESVHWLDLPYGF